MKKLAVALAFLATTLPASAQERPSIGIGIGVVPIEIAGTGPTFEVYLPINVAPAMRVEPSLGVFTNDQRQVGNDSSNVTLGVGVFYVTPVAEPTDMYVGGRLKLNFVTADTATGADSTDVDWALAAAVGGEHFLSPRFSLGAEGQLGWYQNSKLSGAVASNDQGFFTTGLAFLRVYFN